MFDECLYQVSDDLVRMFTWDEMFWAARSGHTCKLTIWNMSLK